MLPSQVMCATCGLPETATAPRNHDGPCRAVINCGYALAFWGDVALVAEDIAAIRTGRSGSFVNLDERVAYVWLDTERERQLADRHWPGGRTAATAFFSACRTAQSQGA